MDSILSTPRFNSRVFRFFLKRIWRALAVAVWLDEAFEDIGLGMLLCAPLSCVVDWNLIFYGLKSAKDSPSTVSILLSLIRQVDRAYLPSYFWACLLSNFRGDLMTAWHRSTTETLLPLIIPGIQLSHSLCNMKQVCKECGLWPAHRPGTKGLLDSVFSWGVM